MMRFNVNNTVRVRLTVLGRNLHRKNHDELFKGWSKPPEYHPVTEDSDGWSEWQLWSLMYEFGQHMHNGANVPFETEIEITDKTL